MTEQQFETMKEDFLKKAEEFANTLRDMSFENFLSINGFHQLTQMRTEATSSYSLLIIKRTESAYKANNDRQ